MCTREVCILFHAGMLLDYMRPFAKYFASIQRFTIQRCNFIATSAVVLVTGIFVLLFILVCGIMKHNITAIACYSKFYRYKSVQYGVNIGNIDVKSKLSCL